MRYFIKSICLIISRLYGFLVSIAAAFGVGYILGEVVHIGDKKTKIEYRNPYDYRYPNNASNYK